MRTLKEITEWKDNTPNHIYYVSNDRSQVLGYSRMMKDEDGVNVMRKEMFGKPMKFDTRYRKFQEIFNTK